MLKQSIQTACAACNDVELCVSPPGSHRWVQGQLERENLQLGHQGWGDLGQRMARALRTNLRLADRVVLIGGDCPQLRGEHIQSAFLALREGCDAAFVPALDGGYVLVGLRRFHTAIFSGIDWSTDQVMSQTRQRLRDLGWRWQEQSALRDVDDAKDLAAFSGF